MASADPMDMSINISNIVGGVTGNFYMRFHVDTGTTYYYWMIDDIKVSSCDFPANFTVHDSLTGNNLFSLDSTNGNITSYLWDFGDGNTSTLANPVHNYGNNGYYTACLTVSNVSACSNTYCDTILICPMAAYFNYTNNLNGNYSFHDDSYGSVSSYSWDFGDGNTSTLADPNHTYSIDGTYSICLTVTDGAVCSKTYCDSISISTSPCNVTSNFSYTDNGSGNYSFNNASTGNIAASYWNFGDGITSNSHSPSHTFLANGPFVVELISIDSTGLCVDYEIITLQVTGVQIPVPCNAAFVIIPDSAASNDVIVYNTSTGNGLTYFWNFGDGNVSSSAFPFYTYTTAGPFQICLTVNDGNGCGSTYCDSISSGGVVFKTGGFNINVQGPVITSIENEHEALSEFSVYPNPFKEEVTIKLNLLETGKVDVFVADLIGNRVAQISNKTLNAGANTFNWGANNIANGVYLLNIKTESSLQVKKLVLNR